MSIRMSANFVQKSFFLLNWFSLKNKFFVRLIGPTCAWEPLGPCGPMGSGQPWASGSLGARVPTGPKIYFKAFDAHGPKVETLRVFCFNNKNVKKTTCQKKHVKTCVEHFFVITKIGGVSKRCRRLGRGLIFDPKSVKTHVLKKLFNNVWDIFLTFVWHFHSIYFGVISETFGVKSVGSGQWNNDTESLGALIDPLWV